ncbi:MAG: histone deacetylase [Pseudomonadota bacterium]
MSFKVYQHPVFLLHRSESPHPESPERLRAIVSRLNSANFPRVSFVQTDRVATPEELSIIHTERHIEAVAATAGKGFGWLDADTYTCGDSYEAARTAVGTVLDAVGSLSRKECTRALALVRPPGHHADRDRAMGFCLFNNTALATQHAVSKGLFRKAAIFDIDAHHGNGTQHIFFDRGDILYMSQHQSPFYPDTGDWNEIGVGDGIGANINCPLPAGSGDAEVLSVWKGVFGPILEQFAPDLLLLSLGFDGHTLDPLAQLQITTEGFRKLLSAVEAFASRASIPVLYILEGGYSPQALTEAAPLVVEVHEQPDASEWPDPSPLALKLLDEARKTFGTLWKL